MTPDRLFPVVLLFACTLVGFAAGAAAGADIHVRVELPEAVVHQGSAAARPEVRVHQVDADLLRDPTALATSGRALLHRGEDGAFDGYRLSAVRRGSALEQLGLANGDVVTRLNGLPLQGMDDAAAAWASLRGTDTFDVDLERNGEPVTLRYRVR